MAQFGDEKQMMADRGPEKVPWKLTNKLMETKYIPKFSDALFAEWRKSVVLCCFLFVCVKKCPCVAQLYDYLARLCDWCNCLAHVWLSYKVFHKADSRVWFLVQVLQCKYFRFCWFHPTFFSRSVVFVTRTKKSLSLYNRISRGTCLNELIICFGFVSIVSLQAKTVWLLSLFTQILFVLSFSAILTNN